MIDSIIFGPQASDLSIGRSASQTTRWQLCVPTLGAANVLRNSGTPGALVINEWLANPRVRVKDDFIELYNPATAPVAIGGISVTNDFANFPNLHRLPALSFVGPRDFAVLLPKGADATPGKASELPFKFPAMSGWAAILGSNDVLIDLVDTDIQFPDATRGRQPDGAATLAHFDVPTPGRPNLPPSAATLALLANLRITEVHYNPLDGNNFEFIELRNIGAAPLTLDGVRFTNGIDFVFPAGATLAPHSFTVLARDPVSFESRYGTGLPVSGFFTGALDNSGESLALTLPAPNDVNILLFEFKDTWHPTTDGGGYSLELIDPSGLPPQDYDKKSSWGASGQLHGTPGTSGPPIITSPLAGSGIAGDPFVYQIAGTNSPSVFGALGLPAGLVVNPTSGLISGAPAAAGQFAVVIQATNSGGTGAATLNLSIAASGPLHHFDWDPLNDQNANLGFGVRVTGRDAEGRMVTAFNGTGTITASQGAGTSSTLVVTEAYDQDPDQFEIQNVSGQSISTSGWFILINNAGQGTNDINTIVEPPLTQPELPATFAPGQVLRVTDDPGASLFFWNNVPWSSVNKRRGWAMIVNSVGTIVDFAIWGYPAADLNSMSVSANGFTLNPLASGAWSGGPVAHLDTPGAGLQRTGDEDHDTAADFAWLPSSLNAQNPSMTVPFSGSLPLPVLPGPISFVNGQAVAVVTISQPAAPARLHLSTAGHSAQSNSFTVAGTLADSDSDGMPNTWESSNGLNPSLNDASGDLDADGQSNLAEFRAGTAANNPLSLLHLLTAETSSSGEITLTWAAVPGVAYRVTESETLGSWAEHPGARVLATGATASVTFDAPAGTPRRFFRIEVLPAG